MCGDPAERLPGRKTAVLINDKGCVLGLTQSAAALCKDGGLLRITGNGTLAAADGTSQQELQLALRGQSRVLVRLRAVDGREFVAVCTPLKGSANPGESRLLLVLAPDAKPEMEEIAALYGLTPAETRLAEALLVCGSLDRAMERLKVTRNTVRAQMTAIFRKTGTTRQGELVRLLTRIEAFAQMCDDM